MAISSKKNASAPVVPGAPGSGTPTVSEPTTPQEPLDPAPDQEGPAPVTATGADTGVDPTLVAQQGQFLTTAHGARLRDTDHSLKAGSRGPTLLQDHHLREKISHFDHERIPERVVHARGAAAHGVFVANGAATSICQAPFLAKDVQTPVFVRFSTVLGRAAQRIWRATPEVSRPGSTPQRATTTWSATTSRSSSSRTASSSRT